MLEIKDEIDSIFGDVLYTNKIRKFWNLMHSSNTIEIDRKWNEIFHTAGRALYSHFLENEYE